MAKKPHSHHSQFQHENNTTIMRPMLMQPIHLVEPYWWDEDPVLPVRCTRTFQCCALLFKAPGQSLKGVFCSKRRTHFPPVGAYVKRTEIKLRWWYPLDIADFEGSWSRQSKDVSRFVAHSRGQPTSIELQNWRCWFRVSGQFKDLLLYIIYYPALTLRIQNLKTSHCQTLWNILEWVIAPEQWMLDELPLNVGFHTVFEPVGFFWSADVE